MTKLLLIILILTTKIISGQIDTINQVDLKGNKNGYWLQYLDERLNPIDSANAYYKGFDLYDHGISVYTFNEHKWFKRDTIVRSNSLPVKGHPEFVSGRFMWFNSKKDSIPNFVRYFHDGHPTYEKCNHKIIKPNLCWNLMSEVLDFTKQYKNIPGTHYFYEVHFPYPDSHYQTSIRRESYYYKKKTKWKYHRIKK